MEFQCHFGYELQGPTHLQCLTDGRWNGTAPSCAPAFCDNLANETSIGMFVTPGNSTVAYGQNVSIICTQQSRPSPGTPFTSFRQCIYDPLADGRQYWLSGAKPTCPCKFFSGSLELQKPFPHWVSNSGLVDMCKQLHHGQPH